MKKESNYYLNDVCDRLEENKKQFESLIDKISQTNSVLINIEKLQKENNEILKSLPPIKATP